MLVGLVVLYGGAHDHDMSEVPLVGALSRDRMKAVFPHPVYPHTNAEWELLGRRLISR